MKRPVAPQLEARHCEGLTTPEVLRHCHATRGDDGKVIIGKMTCSSELLCVRYEGAHKAAKKPWWAFWRKQEKGFIPTSGQIVTVIRVGECDTYDDTDCDEQREDKGKHGRD
jgi:hypothetical protein